MTDNPFESPLVPIRLAAEDNIRFRCHKGISCYNACCKQADITLTPFDIIRLKKRLGMTSTEFLQKHTVPFEMDAHGMPGVKMKTEDDQPVCLFLNEKIGCEVYEDRPAACRYYPLGLMSMRAEGNPEDENHFFLVKEDHCKGHEENNDQTVADYRKDQGVDEYDELNHEWNQIILKKRSSGMTVGSPSPTSFQLFFMASYDIDRFRRFVLSENFLSVFDINEPTGEAIEKDDVALMKFAFQFLKQVLYGEMTIPLIKDVVEERFKRRVQTLEARRHAEVMIHKEGEDPYQTLE